MSPQSTDTTIASDTVGCSGMSASDSNTGTMVACKEGNERRSLRAGGAKRLASMYTHGKRRLEQVRDK